MESYLAGRGHTSERDSSEDPAFRSYLDDDSKQVEDSVVASESPQDEHVEVIYDQADSPKVEVVSVDGKPNRILIHLPDGKLLEISCKY